MNTLATFDFNEQPVRVMERDGSPWFVAADVCRVLEIANSRDAIGSLDEDEKDGVGITDAIGREQRMSAISESGLYALVFKSRKPQAKEFRKWVTSEVLPTIRKTGRYEVGPKTAVAGDRLIADVSEAMRRVLEEGWPVENAAVIQSLAAIAIRARELDAKQRPSRLELPQSNEMGRVLIETSAKFGMNVAVTLWQMLSIAHTMGLYRHVQFDRGGFKRLGLHLRPWIGKRLNDLAGRIFSVQKRRTKEGARYYFLYGEPQV